MKRIVILQLFLFVAAPCVFSQESGTVQTSQQNITYRYISEKSRTESLEVIYGLIDQCSASEFTKVYEHFLYKSRFEPSEKHKAILEYIKNKKNQPK
jgi:hypothetical protein